MIKKNKLSIYLIKDGILEYDDIVGRRDASIPIDDVGIVYIDNSHKSPPGWVNSFFTKGINAADIFTANARALLLVKISVQPSQSQTRADTHTFAVAFGYGKYLLKNDVIEERFGLKVVLNTIKPDSLRRINKVNIGGNQKLSTEQLPLKSGISDFGLDIDRDLVSGITGVSDDDNYVSGIISGSDMLSVTAEVDISNIKSFLESTYGKYVSSSYKDNFAWIDQICDVRDYNLIDTLDTQLITKINAEDSNVWMAVPEIIEWSEIKGFKYFGRTLLDDICLDKVLKSLKKQLTCIKQLKNKHIIAISNHDDSERYAWPAYRCLYGEIAINGHSYCINNGKWHEISSDFVQRINDDYNQTPISEIEFCKYTSEHSCERDYSKTFTKLHPTAYILMDARNIAYGGGHSSIELCDILSVDKKLIHIKPYSGSSTLSHLFNQATVSAELIKSDPSFLTVVNNIIDKVSTNNNFKIANENQYEIVFGIIASSNNCKRPQLPFFSKVSFRYAKQRLLAFGFGVSIKTIMRE